MIQYLIFKKLLLQPRNIRRIKHGFIYFPGPLNKSRTNTSGDPGMSPKTKIFMNLKLTLMPNLILPDTKLISGRIIAYITYHG